MCVSPNSLDIFVFNQSVISSRSRINDNHISKLPDEVLAKILSVYPLDSGSKSVALLTGLWNRPCVIIKPEGKTSKYDFEYVVVKFLVNFDRSNPLRMPRKLEYHFNQGLILKARIGLNNNLTLDFSEGNQDFSKKYWWNVGVNSKGGLLFNFCFKTLKLTSVNSLNCAFVASLIRKFQNVKSLIIEKSNGLVLGVDSLTKLVNLTIQDCDLDSLFVDALELKSLRYSGLLSRFRFYKVMALEDVMLDFKLGSSSYGVKERFDYAGIRSIKDVRVLTLHGWMYKGIFEPWLRLTKHFTLSKLEDLWWIDSCMNDNNISSLFYFLKLCTSLKRLFITIDPRRASSPKPSERYHKCSEFDQKGKLNKLEIVRVDGFSSEEDIISFKEHLMKFFKAEPYVIEVRPGMQSRRLISMAVESNNPSKFSYKFLDEVEDNISLCLKHPHMP
ncbi:hypothetical protein Tco_1072507 [Tanacetum coccineum]